MGLDEHLKAHLQAVAATQPAPAAASAVDINQRINALAYRLASLEDIVNASIWPRQLQPASPPAATENNSSPAAAGEQPANASENSATFAASAVLTELDARDYGSVHWACQQLLDGTIVRDPYGTPYQLRNGVLQFRPVSGEWQRSSYQTLEQLAATFEVGWSVYEQPPTGTFAQLKQPGEEGSRAWAQQQMAAGTAVFNRLTGMNYCVSAGVLMVCDSGGRWTESCDTSLPLLGVWRISTVRHPDAKLKSERVAPDEQPKQAESVNTSAPGDDWRQQPPTESGFYWVRIPPNCPGFAGYDHALAVSVVDGKALHGNSLLPFPDGTLYGAAVAGPFAKHTEDPTFPGSWQWALQQLGNGQVVQHPQHGTFRRRNQQFQQLHATKEAGWEWLPTPLLAAGTADTGWSLAALSRDT